MNLFESNLKLLSEKNKELADRISSHVVNNLETISGYNDFFTVLFKGKLINSLFNPIEEAAVRIESINDIEKLNVIFNIGFGLGYEVNELLRRVNDKCIVFTVITHYDLLKTAMENMDLSNILEYNNFIIIDGTMENFKLYFSELSIGLIYYGANIAIFKHPVEATLKSGLFNKIEKDIIDSYLYSSYGIGNAPGDTLEGLEHILKNIKYILKTFDISRLKGKFKGIPAICVASGPSLNKNFKLLKEVEDKAIIFAADTIIERMKNENIKFHAASVLERPKLMYDKLFKGKPLESDIVLFGESVIYPKIFEENKGQNVVLFKNTTTIEEFLPNKMKNLNEIPTGNSVAHMNFAIAHYLGFSPIIMIGQDLAYSDDGHSHALGTIHESNTLDDDKKEKNIDEIFVESIFGKPVKTTRIWKNFLDWFELEIMDKNILCIDATEGGALIKGTKVMTFQEAIDNYCNKKLTFDFKEFFYDEDKEVQNVRKSIVINELTEQLNQLHEVEKIIRKEKKLLNRFIQNVKGNYDYIEHINKYIDPINKNIYKILQYSVFAFIIQALSVELGRKNNAMVEIKDKEDCIKWYDIQMRYIRDIYGILEITRKILKKGIANIKNKGDINE